MLYVIDNNNKSIVMYCWRKTSVSVASESIFISSSKYYPVSFSKYFIRTRYQKKGCITVSIFIESKYSKT